MSTISNIVSGLPAIQRLIPEPASSLVSTFGQVVSGLAGEGSEAFPGVNGEYGALLQQQMETQEQIMRVSLISNVERAKHETSMAAVRNIRGS